MSRPLLLISVLVLVAVDQIAKQIALTSGIAVINSGIALSLFDGNNLLAAAIALLGLLLVAYLFWDFRENRELRTIEFVPFVLLFAGGIANLADRFVYGGVVDFIKIWIIPTFNLADAMISTGIVLLLVIALYYEYDQRFNHNSGKRGQTT